MFSCEFCEIFKSTIFYRTPLVAASGYSTAENFTYSEEKIFYKTKNVFVSFFKNWTIQLLILSFYIIYICCSIKIGKHEKVQSGQQRSKQTHETEVLILFLFLFSPWFFIASSGVDNFLTISKMLIISAMLKIDDSTVSKCYQSLDYKSVCSACSLRINFDIDLSVCEGTWILVSGGTISPLGCLLLCF